MVFMIVSHCPLPRTKSVGPYFILIAGFGFYYFCLNENVNIVLTCRRSYWSKPEVSPIILCLARCLLIISAIVISIMIMRIVPQKHQIARWGSCTLFIYMYHTFFVRSFRYGVNSGIIPNFIPDNELLLIIIAVALTLALAYFSRYKLPKIIINPFSYLKH